MGKYIMLGNWTEQGVRDAKNTVKRARAVREQFASLGVNAREFFWTMGQYDVVLLMEGTNDLNDRDASIEPVVIATLQQMLRNAKGRGVRPYLATIPPEVVSRTTNLAGSLHPTNSLLWVSSKAIG